jgi:hypothetical protein
MPPSNMANEKVEVTVTDEPNPFAKEAGEFGSDDAELQPSHSPSVDASTVVAFEVRLLDFKKKTRSG